MHPHAIHVKKIGILKTILIIISPENMQITINIKNLLAYLNKLIHNITHILQILSKNLTVNPSINIHPSININQSIKIDLSIFIAIEKKFESAKLIIYNHCSFNESIY